MEEDEISSIRNELKRAFKDKLLVQVQAGGTYKGITGTVAYYGHGTLRILGESEDGLKVSHTLRITDIKRVTVYER
jgi:hypothetical protein